MARLGDLLNGKKADIQTRINNSKIDDLIPDVSVSETNDGLKVVAGNDLLSKTVNVVLSSNEESKASGSGADLDLSQALEESKKIVDSIDEPEYPESLTDVFDQDIKPGKKLKMIRSFIKAYRKSYSPSSKTKDILGANSFTTDKETLINAIKLEIVVINNKLEEFKEINKDVGFDLYDLNEEAKRLVATHIDLLRLIGKNKSTTV